MTTRRKHIPKKVREAVWERDGGACVECGATSDLQLEHEKPLWMGGDNSIENLRLMCAACHRPKTDAESGVRASCDRKGRMHREGRPRARKGPPMKSRPFREWRRFDGSIVRKGA